ncbi:hypothetical protein GF376_03465 [Candidatus Peregrinibacteria bacterium]|nr:hypothetical protein [Candidatus Peregrinibacteria bacterium]
MNLKKYLAIGTVAISSFAIGATAVTMTFPDVPEGAWYESAAEWSAEAGLIQGIDGNFEPATTVNRAQLAVIMQRYDLYMTSKMEKMMKEMEEETTEDTTSDEMNEEETTEDTTSDEMNGEETTSMLTLKLENVSDSQTLSPGLIVIHDETASLDFEGALAPAELEALAEVGNPEELMTLVEELEGVTAVYEIGAIAPGEMLEVELNEMDENLLVSVIQMAVQSNDGYALIDAMPLMADETMTALNYDAGFEENTELGSGFEGGQPDPEEGDANIDNGTATDPQEVVAMHPQLDFDILKATLM